MSTEKKASAQAEQQRMRDLKLEISDFPVFHQVEVLPLKIGTYYDMKKAVYARRRASGREITREEKEEIKAAINRFLAKYCGRLDYKMAGILIRKRYDLDANEVADVSEKDLCGFIAQARAMEAQRKKGRP